MSNRFFLLFTLIMFSGPGSLAAKSKSGDPTRPPVSAIPKAGPKKVTKLQLSEIRIADSNRQAVINGQRLKIGGHIAGYQLKSIKVGYVILTNEKETLRLNLISNRLIRKKL